MKFPYRCPSLPQLDYICLHQCPAICCLQHTKQAKRGRADRGFIWPCSNNCAWVGRVLCLTDVHDSSWRNLLLSSLHVQSISLLFPAGSSLLLAQCCWADRAGHAAPTVFANCTTQQRSQSLTGHGNWIAPPTLKHGGVPRRHGCEEETLHLWESQAATFSWRGFFSFFFPL